MPPAICFDMYGTLCETSSVTDRLRSELKVSDTLVREVEQTWRRKQLEYSQQLALMDAYESFWEVTQDALEYALAQYNLSPSQPVKEHILDSYNHLDPYPATVPALERLNDAGYTVTVLSNGNPAMLERLAANTGLDEHLDHLISADEVETFKPHPSVYENAADRLDRDLADCWLVSGNAWDIAGAGTAGMQTGWVNRHRDPAEAIGADPDVQAPTLSRMADELLR